MPAPGRRAVLLDIEGTTTPLSFVHDVLFPYAAEHCEGFLARRRADEAVREALRLLAEEYREESGEESGRETSRGEEDLPPFGDGLPFIRHLMANDRKSPGLKLLQGQIWKDGYESGRLQGEVFPDVPPAFAAWREAGVRLRIFSSGSVLAQRLLFQTTPAGDLTAFLEGFHDLETGPKHEPGSYRAIAGAFGLPPEAILFLSDVPRELDAAAAAGLATLLVDRPGNAPARQGRHRRIHSFQELF